jgi:chaperonin GroEL
MAKQIKTHKDAREALKRGIDAVANAVKITIGPAGGNVTYDKGYGVPITTNDGVSIAKEIELADPFENMGASIIKEVATKTAETAGDGTTTATILTQAILDEGYKRMGIGISGMQVKAGIEAATESVVEQLKAMARPVKGKEEIRNVATISAESNEMGTIIADTISRVGVNGVVTVEESQSFGITSDVVEGLEIDKGYLSPYMVTNGERMEAEYQNAPVLLTDKKIIDIKDILPLLESLAQSGKKELVIIADDVDQAALSTFVLNKIRGMFHVLAIKAPGFADRKKDMLQDLAIVLGGQVVSDDFGMTLDTVSLDMLGKAAKVIATKDKTIFVDGKGKKEDIQSRIAQIKAQIANSTNKFDIENLEARIVKLSGGVAVIRVGAATETEMKYLKLKIEDAVAATKAAVEEGIVAGGGVALVKAMQNVLVDIKNREEYKKAHESRKASEFMVGYNALLSALVAPLRQMVENSGRDDAGVVVEKVAKSPVYMGYDLSEMVDDGSDPVLVDMLKKGIVDPVKVTRTALQNASSAAAVLLTTQVAIATIPESKKEDQSMGGGMGMY